MHSSGRGEDSPEAYRGVVLPSAQQQPPLQYGEHVQPAGGTPWGAPDSAPAVEPADATQMLPPYPGGDPMGPPGGHAPAPGQHPIQGHVESRGQGSVPDHGQGFGGPPAPPVPPVQVPVADATQMLPPYPGGDPVPAMPPVPPQSPHIPEPSAAEATQALPFFQDHPGQPGGYDQQGGYEQQGYDGQAYDQQPGGFDPYPAPGGPSYGGQEQYANQFGGFEEEQPQQPGPGQDSDYDHLFRQDVPSPAQIRPRIIQPPDRQQPGQQYPQGPGGGYPPYSGQEPGYGPEQGYGDGGRRRMSPKAVIGIVVAGCVVCGLVVGALLNSGGGGGGTHTVADSQSATPTQGSSGDTKTGAAGGPDDAAKQQATALNSLLNTSDTSRSSVVSAVASIKTCDNLAGAAGDLHTAANQRKSLVTQLAKLPLDKLPDHDALSAALTKAWQASSSADTHYANWAGQAQNNHKVCHGGHAKNTTETQAGDRESGTATTEKKKAVKLWNSIAKKYGLTQRQYTQL